MSLHDISKIGSRRIKNPSTNAMDKVPSDFRMAHDTYQINYATDGEATATYGLKMVKGRLEVVDSNGNRIGIMGYSATDADNKIKVAKPGETL